jgi:hypothetical protein
MAEVIKQSKPSVINTYFIPTRQVPPQLKKNTLIEFIGDREVDSTETLFTTHRKLKCTHCNTIKWADVFDWNNKGFEGPYKQFWGKRDCWCKECRSASKSTTYKTAKAVEAQKLKRRKTSTVMDINTSTIIETHTGEQQNREPAYRLLLEQIFYRTTH